MLTTIVTAAASGLGSYQLAKYVAVRAIKRKRSAQQAAHAYRTLKSGALYAQKVHAALADGLDAGEIAKIKAEIAKLKALKDKLNAE